MNSDSQQPSTGKIKLIRTAGVKAYEKMKEKCQTLEELNELKEIARIKKNKKLIRKLISSIEDDMKAGNDSKTQPVPTPEPTPAPSMDTMANALERLSELEETLPSAEPTPEPQAQDACPEPVELPKPKPTRAKTKLDKDYLTSQVSSAAIGTKQKPRKGGLFGANKVRSYPQEFDPEYWKH